jgi:TRAP-type mannitol/chloroaromatic compound transport system substrate-binding protein
MLAGAERRASQTQEADAMRRRDVLTGVGSFAAGATMKFPAPAIAQGLRQLTMVTDWPESLPGLYPSAVRLAQTISEASGGRITIEIFPSGALVRPFETFDAVQAGIADIYHSFEGYFEDKSLAFNFYSGVPFGFTADEQFAWVHYGGGQQLWDELSGQFSIKPFLSSSTGAQMGGWFNDEITSPDGFKGLRYRMPGLGGEVLRRLGAIVVSLPGSEIAPSLRSGAIDASEWIGPWLDVAMGLHEAAGYYYYPGWHEPGTTQTLGINLDVWESFDAGDQRLIEAAAAAEVMRSLAEFNLNNALWLRKLREDGIVKVVKFDDSLLKVFFEISQDVVAEAGSGDEISRRIYDSHQQFRASIMDWSDVAERAFLNSRRIV